MRWYHWLGIAALTGGAGYGVYRLVKAKSEDEAVEEDDEAVEEDDDVLTQEEVAALSQVGLDFDLGAFMPKMQLAVAQFGPTPEQQAAQDARDELFALENETLDELDALTEGWQGLEILANWFQDRGIPFVLDPGAEGAERSVNSRPGHYFNEESLSEKGEKFFRGWGSIRLHPKMFVYPQVPIQKMEGPEFGDELKIHVSPYSGRWSVWLKKGDTWEAESVPIVATRYADRDLDPKEQRLELGLPPVQTSKKEGLKLLKETAEINPTGMYAAGRILHNIVYTYWDTDDDLKKKQTMIYPLAPKSDFRKKVVTPLFPPMKV